MMKKKDFFEVANEQLITFLAKDVGDYGRLRNFDFGPTNRQNVSCLSRYISHRVLSEYQVVSKTLELWPLKTVEKFVQEVFWRVYWKGWLEHRPSVWNDFINYDFENERSCTLQKAVSGRTGIDCFDTWVNELKSKNYLHNHTRMWFASIWVFTLGLSWQSGAKFFLEHYDGMHL